MKKTKLNLLFVFLIWPISLMASEPKTLKLKVDHLPCLECAEKFKDSLKTLCKDLTLDIKKGEALCQYDEPVTEKEIISAAKKTDLPVKKMN